MKTNAKFWDGIAAKYAKMPVRNIKAYEQTLERTQSYLKKSDQVLEVGCGTAATAVHLTPYVKNMLATDCSKAMLEVGRGRAVKMHVDNIEFARATMTELPSGPFDVILAFNLLHLIEDTEGALTEIYERLKPGGYFISKTTCWPEKSLALHFRFVMAVLPVMQLIGKAPFVRMRSVQGIDKIIQQAGFTIVETGNYPAKPPARFVVAKK